MNLQYFVTPFPSDKRPFQSIAEQPPIFRVVPQEKDSDWPS